MNRDTVQVMLGFLTPPEAARAARTSKLFAAATALTADKRFSFLATESVRNPFDAMLEAIVRDCLTERRKLTFTEERIQRYLEISKAPADIKLYGSSLAYFDDETLTEGYICLEFSWPYGGVKRTFALKDNQWRIYLC